MSDELNHIFESVSSQVRHAFSDPTGQKRSPYKQIKESTLGFIHAVDWKETWLIALLTTLLALLCFVLLTRRQTNMQCVLFVFLSVIVFTAENINNFLASHWTSFAKQPYFDKHGVFISTVLTGPLLIIMMTIVINLLRETVSLMIKSKRAEFRVKAKQYAKAEKEGKKDK